MAEVSGQIRVLVVDDDALVRAGLSMLLAGVEEIAIVGEAADGSEVAHAVAEHEPDVVLMDIRMLEDAPRGDRAAEKARARSPAVDRAGINAQTLHAAVLRAVARQRCASGFAQVDTLPPERTKVASSFCRKGAR